MHLNWFLMEGEVLRVDQAFEYRICGNYIALSPGTTDAIIKKQQEPKPGFDRDPHT